MKETHGADYAASLLSSSSNSVMQDSQLLDQLSSGISVGSHAENLALCRDAASRSSISSSIPPRLPDFPWRNEQTLTFELIDDYLGSEEGVLRT
jgi:hypothetical protein